MKRTSDFRITARKPKVTESCYGNKIDGSPHIGHKKSAMQCTTDFMDECKLNIILDVLYKFANRFDAVNLLIGNFDFKFILD